MSLTAFAQRDFFTLDELAATLGVSRSTIGRRVKDGTVPVVRFGGTVRVHRSTLERLASQTDDSSRGVDQPVDRALLGVVTSEPERRAKLSTEPKEK